MEQLTAKFLIEGKVYRPPYRFREIPGQQSTRRKQRLSQGSDEKQDVSLLSEIDVKSLESTAVDASTSSSLFSVLGRGLPTAGNHPVASERDLSGLFDFMDDIDIEDDVFLPESPESDASPPESYEESLQKILEADYGTGGSIRTLLGFLRASLCCNL